MLNSSEDADLETMGTFEVDEHLQGWDASPSSQEMRQQLSAIGMKADERFRRFKVRIRAALQTSLHSAIYTHAKEIVPKTVALERQDLD